MSIPCSISLNAFSIMVSDCDVDALDCYLISKGTGTPVYKGFDPLEVIKLLQGFLVSQKVVALELCEINPLLDEKGKRMAECAVEIVNSLFSFP
ncbi:MAG: hypothetical protein EB076_03980 [Flavobacteriia bacterium]|nr:hypothetical protein [Flavobacteriia bacterium]